LDFCFATDETIAVNFLAILGALSEFIIYVAVHFANLLAKSEAFLGLGSLAPFSFGSL
jgi:hypothetical protein